MKKNYCDVCGIECDDVEPENPIDLAHSKEGDEDRVEQLVLEDMCWPCRDAIADFILKRMKDAEMKHAKAMARRQGPDTPP